MTVRPVLPEPPAWMARVKPAGQWALCALIAFAHALGAPLLPYQELTFFWVYPLVILLPGLITMIMLPGAWRRWYRWAALSGLSLVVFPQVFPLVLAFAETWLLHQSWVTERGAGAPAALRWPFKTKAKPTRRAGERGPATIKEVLRAEGKASKSKKFPKRGSSSPVGENEA